MGLQVLNVARLDTLEICKDSFIEPDLKDYYSEMLYRVVQGIGGALILALGFAVATKPFPPAERGKIMGILASVVYLGGVAGPLIGGFLVKYLSWHWIFLMNLPLGCLGVYMVGKYVPSGIQSPQKTGFDIPGTEFLPTALQMPPSIPGLKVSGILPFHPQP